MLCLTGFQPDQWYKFILTLALEKSCIVKKKQTNWNLNRTIEKLSIFEFSKELEEEMMIKEAN